MTSTEAITLARELMDVGQETRLPEFSRMVLILSHLRVAKLLDVQTFLNATEEVRDFYERHLQRGAELPPLVLCDVCRKPAEGPWDMQKGPPPPAGGPVMRTGPGGDFTKDWPSLEEQDMEGNK